MLAQLLVGIGSSFPRQRGKHVVGRGGKLAMVACALAAIAGVLAVSAGAKGPPPWSPPGSQPPAQPAIDLIAPWNSNIEDGICYTIDVPNWVPEAGAAEAAIGNAVEAWQSAVNNSHLDLVPGPACAGGVDVTIVMRRGGGTVQGTTYPSFDANGDISSARIEIKGKFAGTNNGADQLGDIAKHEFGHALGLGHWNISGQLMSPYLTPGASISACEVDAVLEVQGQWLTGTAWNGVSPFLCDPT